MIEFVSGGFADALDGRGLVHCYEYLLFHFFWIILKIFLQTQPKMNIMCHNFHTLKI